MEPRKYFPTTLLHGLCTLRYDVLLCMLSIMLNAHNLVFIMLWVNIYSENCLYDCNIFCVNLVYCLDNSLSAWLGWSICHMT